MKGFFLPWNEREKQVKRGEKKLYLPKETLSLTDAAFDTHKPAYVSLPNPRGTLRSFLQAVESGKKDEAMGYFVCLSHGGGAKRLRHMENFQYRERGEGINGKSGIAQGLL